MQTVVQALMDAVESSATDSRKQPMNTRVTTAPVMLHLNRAVGAAAAE